MNRKQLILLLAALVIIGGAGLFLLQHRQQSWNESQNQTGRKLLVNFQYSDVAALHLKGDADVTVENKGDGWKVLERGNYPADVAKVRELLIKVSDLKAVQSEPIGASQLARMHLAEPGKGTNSAVLLEFKDARGKLLQSLLLGKKHTESSDRPSPMPFGDEGFANGRYVMLGNDPKTVLTVPDPLNDVDPKPADWLDKDFFKVEKPRVISFVSTNADNSWKVSRESESAPWLLDGVKAAEAYDSNKVASLSSALSYPSFVDVAVDAAPEKTGLDKPLLVTIETFDDFTYTLKIGHKTPENDYDLNVDVTGSIPAARTPAKDEKPDEKAKLDKEFQDKIKPLQEKLKKEQALGKWTYVVNAWLVDPFIRDRSALMVDKKDEKKDAASPAPEPAPPLEQPLPDFLPQVPN